MQTLLRSKRGCQVLPREGPPGSRLTRQVCRQHRLQLEDAGVGCFPSRATQRVRSHRLCILCRDRNSGKDAGLPGQGKHASWVSDVECCALNEPPHPTAPKG